MIVRLGGRKFRVHVQKPAHGNGGIIRAQLLKQNGQVEKQHDVQFVGETDAAFGIISFRMMDMLVPERYATLGPWLKSMSDKYGQQRFNEAVVDFDHSVDTGFIKRT